MRKARTGLLYHKCNKDMVQLDINQADNNEMLLCCIIVVVIVVIVVAAKETDDSDIISQVRYGSAGYQSGFKGNN